MIYDQIDQARLPQWLAQNRIAALALDRLPNGKLIAVEVRRYEDGQEEHVPLLEMTAKDFRKLAKWLKLPIVASRVATEQEKESHRLALRNQSERQSIAMELRGERSAEGWNRAEGGVK